MPAVTITPDDLKPFADIPPEQAQAMCDDALALAAVIAPCILDPRFEYEDAAKAILRQAILRWNAAGSGAVSSQTAGPFGVTIDTSVQRYGMFTKQEIEMLQALCKDSTSGSAGSAWGYDTVPTTGTCHSEICSKTWVANHHCTCGANLTNGAGPLYG